MQHLGGDALMVGYRSIIFYVIGFLRVELLKPENDWCSTLDVEMPIIFLSSLTLLKLGEEIVGKKNQLIQALKVTTFQFLKKTRLNPSSNTICMCVFNE